MRNKRFLSTVVATTLVASTMAMPVMAAGQSGSLDVDLTTKTGVLRVEVPTQMAIAVDQFEITQTGAQIASGVFDMTNKSEMSVKVDVTSTATLGTGINLVSSVDAAKNSKGNDAWLGVAAKTAASSYDDAATADKTEDYYDLTEANANVKTFGSDDKAAQQTFYLDKGSGAAQYALAIPKDNKASISYAEFYALTEIATQPTDDDTLQAAVDASDVYVIETAKIAEDKATVTKIDKGSTVAGGANAWAGTNTYYTAADDASASLTDGTKYVYASMGTAGEAAGFTYVGKLSNAKDTWTKDDIKKIGISYNITGVTATKFNEVKDDCTYGLYKEKPADVAPTFETGDAVGQIKYTPGSGDDALASITKIELTNSFGTFDGYHAGEAYPAATDTDGVITLDSAFMAFFTDGATIQAKVTYTTAGGDTKDTTVSVKLQ